jgi:hypothetical protein
MHRRAALRSHGTKGSPSRALNAVHCLAVVAAALAIGCGEGLVPALQQLVEARQLAAELLVRFTAAADASNRAVMADTDELSVEFADEARQSADQVEQGMRTLRPLLEALEYSAELHTLDELGRRFADYRALDQRILELAVENTNLKAQRLSFGPAAEAGDAFLTALEAVASSTSEQDACRIQASTAAAVSAVRLIQVLEAPHIAEPDDATMARLEERMKAAEQDARRALEELESLLPGESGLALAPAKEALDRFLGVHAEILALSRRNTNVHSLALSMGQKRTLAASCEESLRALQSALAQRDLGAKR